MQSSWRTTVGGICSAVGIALVGIAMSQVPPTEWLLIAGTVLSAVGSALLGLNARDNKVTSEQVGAGH